MAAGIILGREFRWLWTAYASSTFGTWAAFGAFPLIAVLVLDAGPAQVSAVAAAGAAAGALLAVPVAPWVDRRSKRTVMVLMDLIRVAALMTVPIGYWLDELVLGHLVAVAVVAAAADISFRSASGAYLKSVLPSDHLLVANGRLESTTWTAIVLAPPLGGLAMGLLGPVSTVLANAASHLLSAAALRRIGDAAPAVKPPAPVATRRAEISQGWRYLLHHPTLRPLVLNTVLVNGLILATSPLMAVLMLGQLGFAPWQYAVAFGVPCVGGLLGSRLSRPLVDRYGQHRVLVVAGASRACWSLPLAFVGAGTSGLAVVMVTQFGLVTCMGVFNPVLATRRLDLTPMDRAARVLSAWAVTNSLTVAALAAACGMLAAVAGSRATLAVCGFLLLLTPLILRPWRAR